MEPELTPQEPAPQPAGELSPEQFQSGGQPIEQPAGLGLAPAPAAPAPEAPELSIRGLVGSLGYQLGEEIGDDYGAIVHLVQQAERARQLNERQQQADLYAQLGRQLAPRAREILGQPAPAAAPQRKPYEPPPFDDRWQRLLQMDPESGRYVAKHQNVPQSIVDAANDYAEYTQNFLRNPAALIQQVIQDREQTFDQRVQQAVQAGIQQYQSQQAVYGIAQQNAGWFYARDDQGQFLADPVNGGYRVSPLGRQYLDAVRWAAQAGVQDPVMRDQFARQMLRPEIAAAAPQQQQQQPGQPANALAALRQRAALPASRPRINPLQGLPRSQRAETPGATEPDRQSISLLELMRQRMAEEGVQDQHFMAEGAFAG